MQSALGSAPLWGAPERETSARLARALSRALFEARTWIDSSELDLAASIAWAHLTHRLAREAHDALLGEAYELQSHLVPRSAPRVEGYDVGFRVDPVERAGGDLVAFLPSEAGSLRFAVGDVRGHGLVASLLVREVLACLRMEAGRERPPGELLADVNRALLASSPSDHFVSLFYGELGADGALAYASAGHEPALVRRVGTPPGDTASLQTLEPTGPVLGVLADASFATRSIRLEPGDGLLVHTDGLVEARDPWGRLLGRAELERILAERTDASEAASEDLVERLFARVYAFRCGSAPEDDSAALVVRRI